MLFLSSSQPTSRIRLNYRSFDVQRVRFESIRYRATNCSLAKAKELSSPNQDKLIKAPHKYFDQVIITVRSGDGGHGAILQMPIHQPPTSLRKPEKDKGRKIPSYKRDFDGSLILPMGGYGGDVVMYADESKDSLLVFHKQKLYNAKREGNVDAMGVSTSQLHDGLASPTLRIPVFAHFPCTVVKHKRGKLLADLAHPGDEILVARGGQGGKGIFYSGFRLLFQPREDFSAVEYSSEASLADLPGLIEGAHLGKGLGRNILRHLRRTQMSVHVVDVAAEDPVKDYRTVKEELRMYNPSYLERPYIVVLNKIDIPEAMDRLPSSTKEIWGIGIDELPSSPETSSGIALQSLPHERELAKNLSSINPDDDQKVKEIKEYPCHLAVVGVSVLKGIRINEMLKEIRAALRKCRDSSKASELSAKS